MSEPIKVDSHVHLYRTVAEGAAEKEGYQVWEYGEKDDVSASTYPGTVANILEAMEVSGMAKVVVVNLFIAREHFDRMLAELPTILDGIEREKRVKRISAVVVEELKAFNFWICTISRQFPQIVPFVGVDVTALAGVRCGEHVRDMIENHGAHGVKLHGAAGGFNMSDQRLWATYKICEELGAPVIGHSGPDKAGAGLAEPRAFGRMLKEFPRLKVVLAHMGGATWDQALEIAQTYPNAFFDCCEIIEWTGGSNAPTQMQLARLVKDIGPERVMMGSDFPWYDLDRTVDKIMDLPLLSNEEKEGILGSNAIRILDL